MDSPARNEVYLVGRLATAAVERELPSGDVLVLWRLVVDRPPAARVPPGVRSVTVDTLECVSRSASVRRTAGGWAAGDLLSVEGALRRRFWRTPGGASSRYEVDVAKAKRVSRAAQASA
jgi:single-strand DNA-binding protein